MPLKSKSQAKAMFAAAAGKSTLGIPASVGEEFTKGYHGKPGSISRLPKRVKSMTKRGRISSAQAEKLSSKYNSKQQDVDASPR